MRDGCAWIGRGEVWLHNNYGRARGSFSSSLPLRQNMDLHSKSAPRYSPHHPTPARPASIYRNGESKYESGKCFMAFPGASLELRGKAAQGPLRGRDSCRVFSFS
ncbi:hypothetical protein BKA67DRAFT_566060 [Truncatella angustata]|uniref:Uncharacterized protein n=1 Tax=Truncatella angustata TaxID=152316 RepID=A0A9P8UMD6_9PEZI|nr:uncharacterized protein BKA67DRAFT_566060 [Truncatella angustata]KAH6654706.1 hypothetical protein BKA67DRAFT_566060 [Truncatella angustata]